MAHHYEASRPAFAHTRTAFALTPSIAVDRAGTLTTHGAASVLGIAKETIRYHEAAGNLNPRRFGGRRVFERAEVEALAQRLAAQRAARRVAGRG